MFETNFWLRFWECSFLKGIHQHALVDAIFNLTIANRHTLTNVHRKQRLTNLGDEVEKDCKSVVGIVPAQHVMFVSAPKLLSALDALWLEHCISPRIRARACYWIFLGQLLAKLGFE
jgi:hypothetical protein